MTRAEYIANQFMFADWILKRIANNETIEISDIEDAAFDFGLVGWDPKTEKFKPKKVEDE